MDGDDVVMQLVGQIDKNEYMAIGLSKDDSRSNMIGADAVVVWYDGKGHAVDYFLESKQQVWPVITIVNNQLHLIQDTALLLLNY